MRLVFLNLFRSPLRTGLTVVGAAIALFLFCLIESVLFAFHAGVAMAGASRLIVQHKESIIFLVPEAYRSLITQIDGVKGVAMGMWFGGLYEVPLPDGGKRDEFFAQFAVDFDAYLAMYPEILVPPDQLRELMNDRTGCLLGDKIAERLGKKVGDRLPLRGTIWPTPDSSPWEFTVRAIYTSNTETFDRTMMYFHYRYLDEEREFEKGMAGFYVVELTDPDRFTEVSAAIDDRFANSPYPSLTQSEKAFNMQFVSMMGNFELLLHSIGAVVVLTMLLVSANTMMMSARDRTREMAILKAIGFSDLRVFTLLIGEALAVAGLGVLIGVGGAYLLFDVLRWNPKPDFFPIFRLPESSVAMAAAIGMVTGFASGLVPALVGLRLKAVHALRSV